VDDLVEQITSNPAVAKRYSNHFGVSPEKLAAYFKQNLKVITLSAPVRVRTYFVSKDGRILSKLRVLPAGRRVFATLGGDVIAETDCGNPITKKLPPVKSKVMGVKEVSEALPSADQLLAPPIAAVPVAVDVAEQAATRIPLAEPFAALGSAPSILQVAEVVAPLAAGLYAVESHRNVTEVPEPGELAALAFGTCGTFALAVRRLRRNRR